MRPLTGGWETKRLVEDLLTLLRLGLSAVMVVPVNLRAVVETRISATWQMAEAKRVMLALQAKGDIPRIRGGCRLVARGACQPAG